MSALSDMSVSHSQAKERPTAAVCQLCSHSVDPTLRCETSMHGGSQVWPRTASAGSKADRDCLTVARSVECLCYAVIAMIPGGQH